MVSLIFLIFLVFIFSFFYMENSIPEKHKTSAKDFFLHLLSIVTLYASAISLGTVLFQIINITVPDALDSNFYSAQSAKEILRTALSTLIIFFPVLLGTNMYLAKMYAKDAEKRNLRIRKWLVYFTLFATIIIILISLASLVNKLLGGELTVRFFLKLLSILIISGSILAYYFYDIRKHKTE